MTTLNQAREAIYERFIEAWSEGDFDFDFSQDYYDVTGRFTAVTLDNEDFKPPKDDPWVRLAVRHRASTQETLGPKGHRRFARFGAAFVQVFVPQNTGTLDMDRLLTRAREAFEGLTLAGTTVRFLDVIVRETGPDGKWNASVVEAVFEYDETR
ncbi:hypothetical protein ELZ19_06685 [Brucella abortus]|uniref:phage tail terminator-like protein n=1 Tax=Brucella abortus TaxID=235 RepID=UPI0004E8745C|nr:phage tail terminator-like protein [Brucella abortus]KFH18434.1 hypothetical protein IB60_17145 [Brucella abortus LMN1]RUQ67336.1 hypothetical protein ELZ23_15520 [Brucella abortus]RUQ77133.1 hypothetical protein ELZ22_17735 [Brucella abortus]RUQ88277.1 hypothetical protein ELZ18_15560 [Brucella abortus]RUQ90306.1 hypothetical protein ELZ20_15555 [Brucella abortus]